MEEKMRITLHNGRGHAKTGEAFSAKHNDRNFDIGKSDHISNSQNNQNWYWRWNQALDPNGTFEDCEKLYYNHAFSSYLAAQNQRHIASRHPNRVKTMDEYRQSRLGRPEEVILEIGNRDNTIDPETLKAIVLQQIDWEKQEFPNMRVLDIALHTDEPDSAPHVHLRRVWLSHDADGYIMQQQEGALREMGIEPPLPHSAEPRQRYNNRKMTVTRMMREHLQELCKQYGLEIETQPRDANQSGKTLLQLKKDTLNQNIMNLQRERNKLDYIMTQERLYSQLDIQELTEKANHLQQDIADLQAERHIQHDSLLKLAQAKSERVKELKVINTTIRNKTAEFESIKQDIKDLQRYMTDAERNRSNCILRRWQNEELEHER